MSSERRKQFPFDEFEPKWQKLWDDTKAFRTPGPGDADFDASKPKYYVLDMFPYPSGQGLHVGHPEGYTATDIVARFKKMSGFNVLHPMGWDAFGLPAEQYAIKTGQHPRKTTEANIDGFRGQLKRLGFSYDWDREVNTTDPGYFKWTQWIFLQLYNSYFDEKTNKARPISELESVVIRASRPDSPEGSRAGSPCYSREEIDARRLAYVKEAPVWWCNELGTVLANEEVIDGKSEVGGFPVERRPMRQWMLRITAYCQRLIDELDGLDWPEGIKLLQKNWIGKSEGAEVHFKVADVAMVSGTEEWMGSQKPISISVFTTRPDTLFGATYMVLAPEHPLVEKIIPTDWPANTPDNWKGEDQSAIRNPQSAIASYRERTARKSDLERTELAKEKSGVFTGAFAINPVNNERIPIWIADYVLLGYGTGAIMAVPAHDERDFEFATKFELPIKQVVASESSKGVSPLQSNASERAPFITHDPEDVVDFHQGENLPHWRIPDATYAVTFRLADAVPSETRRQWEAERLDLKERLQSQTRPLTKHEASELRRLFSEKVQAWLDAGHGSCLLRDPQYAGCVAEALKHFHGERYDLLAWCVMPNHVHVILKPRQGHELSNILQSWKSFAAKALNKLAGKTGEVWQADNFNRIIRDEAELLMQAEYVRANPERAGLQEWKWVWVTEGILQGRDALATAFSGEGIAVNSGFLDGLTTLDAKSKITAWLTEKGLGAKTTNFKLRDWLFSRQRYWGEPFPIVWEDGHHRALPESDLPLVPPDLDDFKPTGTPEPPLSKATAWVKYSDKATRELNTMPQWAGSCWYYLRYCDPKNSKRFVGSAAERYWMGGWIPPFPKDREKWKSEMKSLYDYSRSHKGGGERHRLAFGFIDDEHARSIREAVGTDLKGMFHVIDSYAVNHIVEGHGSAWTEEQRGQLLLDQDDFARLPDVVAEPDRILDLGKTQQGLPVIGFVKRFNGHLHVVEEVRAGRNILAVLTMYKRKAASDADMVACSHTSETIRFKTPFHHYGKVSKPELSSPEYFSEEAKLSRSLGVSPSPGVDLYVGGTEHAVLHLLYARFWHKVLFDLGHVSTPEPFQRLVNQGLILGEDNQKMSKSRGNVVNPDDVVAEYGADSLRLYEMFMGPLEQVKPWSMKGVEGVYRYLAKVWRLVMEMNQEGNWALSPQLKDIPVSRELNKSLHQAIKLVGEGIETLSFNTCISDMMKLAKPFIAAEVRPASGVMTLLQVLNPFAPHITEELATIIGEAFPNLKCSKGVPPLPASEQGRDALATETTMLAHQTWPTFDPTALIESEVEVIVQVNGKLRDRLTVPLDAPKEDLEKQALANAKVAEFTVGLTVRKVVVVPNKLVNIVAN